jgi:hypothetical protein
MANMPMRHRVDDASSAGSIASHPHAAQRDLDQTGAYEMNAGVNAGVGAAVAAAAAKMQAIKASGVIIHVEPEELVNVVRRQSDALVVQSTFGLFSTHYNYITSYKGLAFYATSPDPLEFPHGTETIEAKSIWVPS